MKCIFCGRENDVSNNKCQYCGYLFSFPKMSSGSTELDNDTNNNGQATIEQPDAMTKTENDSVGTEKSEEEIPLKYKWKHIPIEIENKENNTNSHNNAEVVAAIILWIALIGVILFGVISNGSIKVLFEIKYMIIIGIIGIVGFLLTGAFEGEFPGSIPGLIIRSFFLMLAWEAPNIITIPLYLAVLFFSIAFLVYVYLGNWRAVFLGAISVICLPFLGVFIAIIVSLFFREMSSGKRKNRNGRR